MLMVYCEWYDRTLLPLSHNARACCGTVDVLWHLLLVIAMWPWPLPFTAENMFVLGSTKRGRNLAPLLTGGPVLEQTVGRHQATSFVVPLPCGSVWNTTQAVQFPQHMVLLREAWEGGLKRLTVGSNIGPSDFAMELHDVSMRCQWPLYLLVNIPRHTPCKWQAMVGNRIVLTLVPQLEVSGFFCRPLCRDDPFIFLLWPREYQWSQRTRAEAVLPLRKRVGRVLFHMLSEAHRLLWPVPEQPPAPELFDLLPTVTVACQMPREFLLAVRP